MRMTFKLAAVAFGVCGVIAAPAALASAETPQDYKPLMTFSGDRAWIHGYRQEPQVQYASNAGSVQPGEGPGN